MRKSGYSFAFAFIIFEFAAYISNDMIMPGMVKVIQEFKASPSLIASSFSLYVLGASSLQLFLGPIADRYGEQKLIWLGVILFIISTILIPFSLNIETFLIARFIEGMSLCFMFLGYAIIHKLFNDQEAVKVLLIISNVSMIAPLMGPLLGSYIVSYVNWRFIFIFPAIMAIIAFIWLIKTTPKIAARSSKLSFKSVLSVYKQLLKNRTFMFGVAATSFDLLPLYTWMAMSPAIFLVAYKKTLFEYSMYQLIVMGAMIISSLIMHKLTGKFSMYNTIRFGGLFSLFGLIFSLVFAQHIPLFILGMSIYSFGLGIFTAPVYRIIHTLFEVNSGAAIALWYVITGISYAAGLELTNHISKYFTFSLLSFATMNLVFGILYFIFLQKFNRITKDRAAIE